MNAYSASDRRTVIRDGTLSLPDLHRKHPFPFNDEYGITLPQHLDPTVHDHPVSGDLENDEIGRCAGAEGGDVTSRASPAALHSNNEYLQTLHQNPYRSHITQNKC